MKKYLALLLALVMVVAAFAGCGETKQPAGQGGKPSEQDSSAPYGIYRTSYLSAVTTVNTYTTTDTYPSNLAGYCSATLYTQIPSEDRNHYELVPDVAAGDPVQMDDNGCVFRIPITKDFYWVNSNMEKLAPMTADDCIYTFKMALDPLLLNVNGHYLVNNIYASIKGVEEYKEQGSLGIEYSWDDVGIQKIDDYTIEITTTMPTTSLRIKKLFCGMSTMLVYEPLFEACMSPDRTSSTYGTSLEQWASCGKFVLTGWVTDSKYELKRNPYYRYADNVHLEGISIRVVPDANTALEMFLNGELDDCLISYQQWPDYEDDPRVMEFFNDSTMFLYVNTGNPNFGGMLGNLNFRKALFYGIDRVEIAKSLNARPYSRIVRRCVIGDDLNGTAFVDLPQDFVEDPYNIYKPALATEYLDKAFEETRQVNVTFEIYYKEDGTHTRAATELMQNQIEKNMEGVVITIRSVPQAQAYTLRRWNPADPDAYDMNIGSLLPGSMPIDTFKFYNGGYTPPRFYWANKDNLAKYDELYQKAVYETDEEKINELCLQMEKILLCDEVMQIPVYEVSAKQIYSSNIKLPVDSYVIGYGFGESLMTMTK